MQKHLTLIVSLYLTQTVNLTLRSDWLIGMLIKEHVVLGKNNPQKSWKLITILFKKAAKKIFLEALYVNICKLLILERLVLLIFILLTCWVSPRPSLGVSVIMSFCYDDITDYRFSHLKLCKNKLWLVACFACRSDDLFLFNHMVLSFQSHNIIKMLVA